MSLTFGAATSDRVRADYDALTGFDPFTVLLWAYPTTLTTARVLFVTGNSTGGNRKIIRLEGTVGDLNVSVVRATANADFNTSDTPFATLNKWYCLMVTFDSTASPTVQIFVGDASTPLALRTCAVTATNGTGAVTQEGAGGRLALGNRSTDAPILAFQGREAVAAYFSRVLTVGEGTDWQFSPRMLAGCAGLWRLGDNGVGTQPDLSGNGRAGTVTGATQSDNSPLGRWPRAGPLRVPSAVPVATAALFDSSMRNPLYNTLLRM